MTIPLDGSSAAVIISYQSERIEAPDATQEALVVAHLGFPVHRGFAFAPETAYRPRL